MFHSRRRRPHSRTRLPDELASHLRDRIMTGALAQGTHLHLEGLSRELGVSVTPVREALLTLRAEGFVALEPRRGFVVATLSRRDVEDAYRVQALLAGELAARAATVIGTEELAELEFVQAELENAAQRYDGDLVEELNLRFHDFIDALADSPKLSWFLRMSASYAPRRFMATVEGGRAASATDHRTILTAFREHDAESARATMADHITHGGALLIRHLDRQKFWRPEK